MRDAFGRPGVMCHVEPSTPSARANAGARIASSDSPASRDVLARGIVQRVHPRDRERPKPLEAL